MCQLRSFKQIGTSDPHSEVAICQPGSVSLVRCSTYYFWLLNQTKWDKLQALPGVLGKRLQLVQVYTVACRCVKAFDEHCSLPVGMFSNPPKMSGSDCSEV